MVTTVAVMLTLRPVRSNAQTPEQDPSQGRFHFGPLFLTPSLVLRELGVDTNVFNSADDPKSDFTMTLQPQVAARATIGRRLTVRGTGGANLVYYAVYTNQRSVNGNYDVRTDLNLDRITLFVTDGLVNTRDRPSYEIDIRPRHTDHGTGGGAIFKLHDKLSFEVSGRASQIRYESTATVDGVNLANSLDSDSTSVGGNIAFRLTPYTTVNLRGDAIRDRFTGTPLRNSNSVLIQPGVTFSPRALISGTASVGFRRFEALGPGVPNYSGLVANASLSYRMNGSTILNTAVDRGLNYSFEPLGPYYIQNNIAVNVRRQLAGRFDATAGVLHSVYDYKSVLITAVVPAVDDREDTTVSYSFDVGYRANRKTRIGFGVESWHRNSNQRSDLAYTGFRFRSTATVAF